MTKTFDELDDKVDRLEAELAATQAALKLLRIELYGDVEQRELFHKNRDNNVAPNIPEPPIGALHGIMNMVSSFGERINANSAYYSKSISDVTQTIAWATKLEKFFSPMIDGLNPPLDGAQVATKAFVDQGIARIAGAIREEIARDFSHMRIFMKTLTQSAVGISRRHGEPEDSTPKRIADRLSWAWTFVQALHENAQARARRPSRLGSFLYAVTGYEKTNGASR